MTAKIKLKDLSYYTRLEEMNLEELKENAEALNTPATAFDILTLHKSISILEKKINELSDELSDNLVVTLNNGSEKKARIADIVLEIYENQKTYRVLKTIVSLIKSKKSFILLIVLAFGFIIGSVFGKEFNIDIIKLLLNL